MISCAEWIEQKFDVHQISNMINVVNDGAFCLLDNTLLLFGHLIGLLLVGLGSKVAKCSQTVGRNETLLEFVAVVVADGHVAAECAAAEIGSLAASAPDPVISTVRKLFWSKIGRSQK